MPAAMNETVSKSLLPKKLEKYMMEYAKISTTAFIALFKYGSPVKSYVYQFRQFIAFWYKITAPRPK